MTAKKWIINDWGEEWLSKEWQAGDVIDALQQFAAVKVAEATKEMYPKKFIMWVIYTPPDDYSRLLSQINFSGKRPSIDKLFEYWKQNIQGK